MILHRGSESFWCIIVYSFLGLWWARFHELHQCISYIKHTLPSTQLSSLESPHCALLDTSAMTQPNPVAQTVEVVATSPLSSLPTSPLLPLSDANNASDNFLYDYTYSDTFEPAAKPFTPQQKLEKVIHTLCEVH